MAKALGMTVAAYDPFVTSARGAELGVGLASTLEELLGTCDVVSLHVPLGPETRHMINAHRLAQMKPGAVLISDGVRAAMAAVTCSRPGLAVMIRTIASFNPALSRANAAGAGPGGP